MRAISTTACYWFKEVDLLELILTKNNFIFVLAKQQTHDTQEPSRLLWGKKQPMTREWSNLASQHVYNIFIIYFEAFLHFLRYWHCSALINQVKWTTSEVLSPVGLRCNYFFIPSYHLDIIQGYSEMWKTVKYALYSARNTHAGNENDRKLWTFVVNREKYWKLGEFWPKE